MTHMTLKKPRPGTAAKDDSSDEKYRLPSASRA